ncbi:MAG: glycosyltransferase family 4 protein [Candidatus Poseidonia sp.]|nr:glycosyltransferase family 4 protein [Poseidonia sp.]MBL6886369.1 glycosyltransferase family 4 protein [Poseidonia sp.]
MHIAMVSGEYPPRWDGIGSVVYHLAGHLAQRGHDVTIITRSHKQRTPQQPGVSVLQVPWLKAPMASTRSYGKYALTELRRLHQVKPVDVVHTLLPLVSWTKKEFRWVEEHVAPVVSALNGSWVGQREGMKLAARHKEAATWKNPNDLAILLTGGWYARYEQAAIEASSVCVAISKSTKEEFQQWYLPPDDWSCETVLYGVDHKVFRPVNHDYEEDQLAYEEVRKTYDAADDAALMGEPDTSTPLLLAVGRLLARKGHRTLLRAMPSILKAHPGAKLVIIGRGHMRKTLMRQAKRLGISDAVVIKGGMNFEHLALHFRSADLVVYPSYYEGQGLIPLEALASGTPVVTVDQAPLTEMIDETVGGLFACGDSDDLARSVIESLDRPKERREQAARGRERVLNHYTYEHNAEAYEGIYVDVVNS